MMWFLVVAVSCVILHAASTSPRRERDFSHDPSTKELDNQIDALRDRLYSEDAFNVEDVTIDDMNKYSITQSWYTLGALLQRKDLYFHPCGGCLQQESIDVFSECIFQLNHHLSVLQSYSMNNAHNEQLNSLLTSLREMQNDAYHRRGVIYRTMGRPTPAIKDHETCLTFFPTPTRKASILFNKASALMMLRDEDSLVQADEDLEEALSLNPVQQEIYPTLVELRKAMKNKSKDKATWQSLLQDMEGVIDTEPELDSTRSEIYWALYEVCEKLKDFDKAFHYLQIAHNVEWRKKKHLSNLDSTRLQHQQVTQVFTPEFWKSAYGLPDERGPIFIIGMLRSGSTLLETLLDKHDSVHGIGEYSIFNSDLPLFRNELVAAIEAYKTPGMPGQVGRGRQPNQVVQDFGRNVWQKMLGQAQKASSPPLSTTSLSSSTSAKGSPIRHVLDKMLFNYRNVGFIHLVYPDTPILHMVRDPLDNMFSAYRKKFDDSNMEWTLNEEHIVAHYVAYLEVMAHFRSVLPNRVIDIRYEELVNFPNKVMQRLTRRIGVEYTQSLLEIASSKRVIHTHSRMQMQQGVHNGSIGTWTRYSKHLGSLRSEWKRQVGRLRREGVLPFADRMNWDGDASFDYGKEIYEYHHSTIAASDDEIDEDSERGEQKDISGEEAEGEEGEEEEEEDNDEYEYLVEVIDEDGTVITSDGDGDGGLFVTLAEDGSYVIQDSEGEQPYEVVEVVDYVRNDDGNTGNSPSEVSSVSTPSSIPTSASTTTSTPSSHTDLFRSLIKRYSTPALLHKHTSLLSFLGLSSDVSQAALRRDCVLHGSTPRRHISDGIFDIHAQYNSITLSFDGEEEGADNESKEKDWLEGASHGDMKEYIREALKKSEKAYQTLKIAVKGAAKAAPGGDLLGEARGVMERAVKADRVIAKQRRGHDKNKKDTGQSSKSSKVKKSTEAASQRKESKGDDIRKLLSYTPNQVRTLLSTILDKHLPLSVADASRLSSTLKVQPSASLSLPIDTEQLPGKVRDKYKRVVSSMHKKYTSRSLSTLTERTNFVREVYNVATSLVNNGYHAYAVALAEVLLFVQQGKTVSSNLERDDGSSNDGDGGEASTSLAASHLDIMKLMGTVYAMRGQYEESYRIFHTLLVQDEAIDSVFSSHSSSSSNIVGVEDLLATTVDLDLIGRLAEVAQALDRKQECMQLSDFTLLYCDALKTTSIDTSPPSLREQRESECALNVVISTIVRKASLLMQSKQTEAASLFIDAQRQSWQLDSLSVDDSMGSEMRHYLSRLYHLSGKRHSDYGEWQQGVVQQDRALTFNPKNTDAMLDKAICLLTLSQYQSALSLIEDVLAMQPQMKSAYGYRGLLYQNLGQCSLALVDLERVLAEDPMDKSCLLLSGSCYHSQGNYSAALHSYNRLLQIDPDHSVIYRREILLHEVVMLDEPYDSYHPDAQISADIKKGVSYGGQSGVDFKKERVFASSNDGNDGSDGSDGNDGDDRAFYYTSEAFRRGIVDGNGDMTAIASKQYDIDSTSTRKKERGRGGASLSKEDREKLTSIEQVLQRYKHVTSFVQLAEAGFLPHDKAHKQFILSTVAMAQLLQSHVQMLVGEIEREERDVLLSNSNDGSGGHILSLMNRLRGSGLLMRDTSASTRRSHAFTPKGSEKHALYWRDYFDLSQRWRFVAEPFDGVFWADGLDLPTEFKNRVGLSTNLISGLNKVVRYYPQLPQSLRVTKDMVMHSGYYDGEDAFIPTSSYGSKGIDVTAVQRAETVEELFVAMESQNFIVVTDVQRREGDDGDDDDEALPGIVFALIKSREHQHGWEYGINIPNTLPRFRQYEREVHFAFERMVASLLKYAVLDGDDNKDGDDHDSARTVLLSALELFYFWANFGALTRGTSATGYSIITSAMLSIGYDVEKRLPPGMQLDWEAFYAKDAVTYSREILQYLHLERAEQRVEVGERVMDLFENMRMVRRAFLLEI